MPQYAYKVKGEDEIREGFVFNNMKELEDEIIACGYDDSEKFEIFELKKVKEGSVIHSLKLKDIKTTKPKTK